MSKAFIKGAKAVTELELPIILTTYTNLANTTRRAIERPTFQRTRLPAAAPPPGIPAEGPAGAERGRSFLFCLPDNIKNHTMKSEKYPRSTDSIRIKSPAHRPAIYMKLYRFHHAL